MQRIAPIILGVCLGTAVAAEPLSQAQAVARVLERHPAGHAARRQVAAAEARVDRVAAAWLPRVQAVGQAVAQGPVPTLSIDTGLTPPGAAGPLQIEREIGQTVNSSATLELGWRALDFGGRAARVEAARAGVAASEAEARARAVDLAWAARQAYASARFFAAVVDVSTQAARTATHDVAAAEARRAAGLGASVEVAAARSRLADRVAQQAAGDAGLARARATLTLLLDLPAVELTDDLAALADAPIPTVDDPSPAESRARAGAAAKRAEADGVAATRWPTLDVLGSAGYAAPRTFVEDSPGFTWRAGVRLAWSLFDGDEGRRHRRELEAEVEALTAAEAAAFEARARAVADARARLRAARVAVATAEARVEAAEIWLTAARAGQKAGTVTALDVEHATDRLDAARLAVAGAQLEAASARADHLRADGVAQAPMEANR